MCALLATVWPNGVRLDASALYLGQSIGTVQARSPPSAAVSSNARAEVTTRGSCNELGLVVATVGTGAFASCVANRRSRGARRRISRRGCADVVDVASGASASDSTLLDTVSLEAIPVEHGLPIAGLRVLRLPEAQVLAAHKEIEDDLQQGERMLEMQYSYSAGKHGSFARLPGRERYPASYELMEQISRAFGIDDFAEDRLQVVVRYYDPPQDLGLHLDSTVMFEEPVLSVVLRCDNGRKDGQGDGLVLRPWSKGATDSFAIDEEPGVCVCLEGDARYKFGHEVPTVGAQRLSLTWRWFHGEYLDKLWWKAHGGKHKKPPKGRSMSEWRKTNKSQFNSKHWGSWRKAQAQKTSYW